MTEWRAWREGAYEVSDDGRVRRAKPGRRTKVGQEMTPVLMKIGYYAVGPTVNGKNETHTIHSMMAECFLPADPSRPHVNHKNGVKSDNRLENLERCTRKENMEHAARMGLMSSGEDHYRAKLDLQKAEQIRADHAGGESMGAIGRRLGLAVSTVWMVVHKKRWAS